MELAILFWCYKEPGICVNKLRLLRHYNPDAPIYVLFGGDISAADVFESELRPYVDDFYVFPELKSADWKWEFGDVLISRWFRDRGHLLEWDSVAVIQWDMLVFAPVEQLFGHLQKNELLLSGLRPMAEVRSQVWWTREGEPYREYRDFLAENGLGEADAWSCLFVVAVFPREFLQRFADRFHPEKGFLEYTIPTLAKSWGFDFCTRHPYHPWWWDQDPHPYYKVLNADKEDCADRNVLLHLLDPGGLRIFHPYRRDISVGELSHALPAWRNFLRCADWDYADLFSGATRALARHAIAGNELAIPDPLTTRPAVCLSMVVGDDPAAAATVDSIAPLISSWVVVYVGADGEARDRIRAHLERLGVPGEFYQRPWRDAAGHRAEALTLAQGHGDYIWVLDAGETVVGVPDFARLSADVYWLRCRDGTGGAYWRAQLFRDGMRVPYAAAGSGVAQYDAAIDESPCVGECLAGEYHVATGAHRGGGLTGQQRYVRDRELLLAAVERNPADARSVSALAQGYFDQGDFATARDWFTRRVELGGPEDGVYLAMHRTAESMHKLGEPWQQVQDAYLLAWEFRPTRAEPLYAIARAYRLDERYWLGYLFAERATEIPYPEQDASTIDTDAASIYAWRATDEQAVCASWIGRHAEAFTLWRRALASAEIPDEDRQRIAANRDLCVPELLEAASAGPEPGPLRSLRRRRADRTADVVVSLIAGPDLAGTERTLASFLRCCLDAPRVRRFLVVDTHLPAADRATLSARYEFVEFVRPEPADYPGDQLGFVRSQVRERFWLHLGQGWTFFAPENLITRLLAVCAAEAEVFQVGINFADAAGLTGASAAESVVRRAPDTGRYLVTGQVARGPAMFEVPRLDRAGGPGGDDPDPIAALGGRATAAGLRTASLDEVLCIAAT